QNSLHEIQQPERALKLSTPSPERSQIKHLLITLRIEHQCAPNSLLGRVIVLRLIIDLSKETQQFGVIRSRAQQMAKQHDCRPRVALLEIKIDGGGSGGLVFRLDLERLKVSLQCFFIVALALMFARCC